MENISFLIGSGFSVPAEFPTTSEINARLSKINASEICLHTSGDVWFLNGNEDLNAHWMGVEGRNFIQEFLEFFCTDVLDTPEDFHYETFYDYYHEYLTNPDYPKEMVDFFDRFQNKYRAKKRPHELLSEFNRCYNQLIAHLLAKPFERCHLSKPYHPNYDKFLHLVEALGQRFIVDPHSLNHDLYLEHLAYSDSMQAELDDGFEELGSPFYGQLLMPNERYMVRLSRFTNCFSKRFRLYKLHGSINRYWFKTNDSIELIQLKWGLGKTDAYKEISKDGRLSYDFHPLTNFPDFLSGTTFKTRQYSSGDYYPTIFKHFEDNLNSSEFLIIIGYGFNDSVINQYIENSFLNDSNKPIFIVDIREPNSDFLSHENVFFISGGVVGMDNEFIQKRIGL